MAFQVNPQDPNYTEQEWKIGVQAYEAGLDPIAAIEQFKKNGFAMVPHTEETVEVTEEKPDGASATSIPGVSMPKGRKK